ncbi:MAG: hypothetical protein SGILL_007664, partial [Bacillariaceae sp.]
MAPSPSGKLPEFDTLSQRYSVLPGENGEFQFVSADQVPNYYGDKSLAGARSMFSSLVETLMMLNPYVKERGIISELKHSTKSKPPSISVLQTCRRELFDKPEIYGRLSDRLEGLRFLLGQDLDTIIDPKQKRLAMVIKPDTIAETAENKKSQMMEVLSLLWELSAGDSECQKGLTIFLDRHLCRNKNTPFNSWKRLAAHYGELRTKSDFDTQVKAKLPSKDLHRNPHGLDLDMDPFPTDSKAMLKTFEWTLKLEKSYLERLFGSGAMSPIVDQLATLARATGNYLHSNHGVMYEKACVAEPLRSALINQWAERSVPTLIPPPNSVFFDQFSGANGTLTPQAHAMLTPQANAMNALGLVCRQSSHVYVNYASAGPDLFVSEHGYGSTSRSLGRISVTEKGVYSRLCQLATQGRQDPAVGAKFRRYLNKGEVKKWLDKKAEELEVFPIPNVHALDPEDGNLCGTASSFEDFEILHVIPVESLHKKVHVAHPRGDPSKLCAVTTQLCSYHDFRKGARELVQQTQFPGTGLILSWSIFDTIWDSAEAIALAEGDKSICLVTVQPLASCDALAWILETHEGKPDKPGLLETFKVISPHVLKTVAAVKTINDNGVRHQDVKPPNLLIGHSESAPGIGHSSFGNVSLLDGVEPQYLDFARALLGKSTLQLADFGVSRETCEDQGMVVDMTTSTKAGTRGFLAPDWMNPPPEKKKYREDLFALSVTIFCFIAGTCIKTDKKFLQHGKLDVRKQLNARFKRQTPEEAAFLDIVTE